MGFGQRNPFSRDASTDLSGSQWCGVKLDANGQLALPTAGGAIIGILTTKPAAQGRSGSVVGPGIGITKCKYGGGVTAGDVLKVTAAGLFVTALAADIAAGAGVAVACETGVLNDIKECILFGGASTVTATGGVDDIVLGTTAPSNTTSVTYVQTSGTKTGVLAAGVYTGQTKDIIQSVAAATPVGTITGTFKTLAGAAATTLALGTAVAYIAKFVWDGAAWRAMSAITGTGSSLA